MRCLSLAQAFRAQGVECALATRPSGVEIARRFGGGPIHAAPVEDLLKDHAFDILIVDDYAIGAQDEQRWRPHVSAMAVIDDLADRPHAADLLVDPGYGRRASDYAGLVPTGAQILTGPAFALVRPAFAALRPVALARSVAPTPRRAFVSFGLSDVDGVAARAVGLIRVRYPDLPLDVALSSDAASLGVLEALAAWDANLRLHVDTADVARLMATADMAVGAGGASTWERACLGLPTLAVIVADNQRAVIKAMAADGALLAVDLYGKDFDEALDAALVRIGGADVRATLRDRSATLCDALGAERIAEAVLAL
jgi:UDP-2,4-diacetamido-2,4,6-trideoxy-beta-L-altropyranose hydrolase